MTLHRLLCYLLAIFVVAFPTSGHCPELTRSSIPVDLVTIRYVHCGGYVGTGEIIAPDTILTAAHVVKNTPFCMDAETLSLGKIVKSSDSQDIAILIFPHGTIPTNSMPYSCRGFDQEFYVGYGWAHGIKFTASMLVGNSQRFFLRDFKSHEGYYGMFMLRGVIIPGMSGGPIVDFHGVMTGMNSLTEYPENPRGYSRALRDTFLCGVIPSDLSFH